MRIAIATNSLWNFLKFRKNLAKSLLKKGNQIYVFTEKKISYKKRIKDIKFINIPIQRNPYNIFNDLFLIFYLFKYFHFFKIEYFLGFSHKINIYGGLVCKILKIKSILNITGLGTAIIESTYSKIFLFFLYKITSTNNSYYLFHNYHDQRLFLKSNLVSKKNSIIIPGSGIDLTRKIVKAKKKKKFFSFYIFRKINLSEGTL